jgi:hypothetical protein
LGNRLKQSRSIVGHAIDRGRNFVGFEEIFARCREQRSVAAGSPACGGGWDAAHKAEGKPFSLTFRIYVAKEAAQKCEWTPLAVEKVN